MKKRSIGSLQVSEVGIGCNNFGMRLDFDGTKAVVDSAIENGINFFDTADIYGGTKSEVLLGQALGSRRAEVIIASKFGMPIDEQRFGAKPDYVRSACEDSLKRLGTDYIDLYQVHRFDHAVNCLLIDSIIWLMITNSFKSISLKSLHNLINNLTTSICPLACSR